MLRTLETTLKPGPENVNLSQVGVRDSRDPEAATLPRATEWKLWCVLTR